MYYLALVLAIIAFHQNRAAELSMMKPIGTGLSQGRVNSTEQVLFTHTCINKPCVMNHIWMTGAPCVDNATIRYYVDEETHPSIEFQPYLACAAGFDDQTSPWATKWFGKGAKSTGWFHNFKIPFSKIRITFQNKLQTCNKGGNDQVVWLIVRGSESMNLRIGDLNLPENARLKLLKTDKVLQPLEFVDIANIRSSNSGLFFQVTMQVNSSKNFNFMEGCFHYYDDTRTEFPGMLLSTGMEDYFDSAFYFNGGEFHFPVSGNTHQSNMNGVYQWSGYRFHDMDPLVFSKGMRFQWRNGDVNDPVTGLKCTSNATTNVCGNPQKSHLISYAWVYVW
jgi:hypothetical protein